MKTLIRKSNYGIEIKWADVQKRNKTKWPNFKINKQPAQQQKAHPKKKIILALHKQS